ncbi:DNA-binding response regulator [Clostridia bacterium]|nr:DNA-binding response regulator [Clostridia bacterium]
MANRVLVVDDEKLIVKGIKTSLERDGMSVDYAYDGEEAIQLAEKKEYDIVLLDIMLPKFDGFEVCQRIREFSEVPIIMLTAKGDDMDKILGLEYGADDYITKPFNILEVKARIKAIIRRNSKNQKRDLEEEKTVISVGKLTLNRESKRVILDGKEINLSLREFALLELMALHPGKVYSREDLLSLVWSNKIESGDVRTIDVHIRRLREKIEPNPSDPNYVKTKWGVGYYFQS